MNAYSNFICNDQNVEATKPFFKMWMNKQWWSIIPNNGIPFSDKNEWAPELQKDLQEV